MVPSLDSNLNELGRCKYQSKLPFKKKAAYTSLTSSACKGWDIEGNCSLNNLKDQKQTSTILNLTNQELTTKTQPVYVK